MVQKKLYVNFSFHFIFPKIFCIKNGLIGWKTYRKVIQEIPKAYFISHDEKRIADVTKIKLGKKLSLSKIQVD